MSLLLDALKKAADDKQKAALENSANQKSSTTDVENSEPVGAVSPSEETSIPPEEEALTLVLDNIENGDAVVEDSASAETTIQASEFAGEVVTPPPAIPEKETAATEERYEVSDEALSMLINKTNREVKLSRRLLVTSALFITLAIMISGGIYYYMDTQDEIANLERKHRIAMLAMKAKTSGEQEPSNAEVIRNLVSNAELEEKVAFAKKHIAKKKVERTVIAGQRPVKKKSKADRTVLSIQKTNRVDPIEEKLEAGWQAYEAGDLPAARKYYQAVLNVERKNRDALLGLGAIAMMQHDSVTAAEHYLVLLELDPRDPIATGALSGLQFEDASLEQHEEHLVAMLKKMPDAAALNFALGNVYARQGKWKAAQQSYFSAWQHDTENAGYLFNLAVSMDQLGKHEQAIDFYSRCLQRSETKQTSFSQKAVKKRINELSGFNR